MTKFTSDNKVACGLYKLIYFVEHVTLTSKAGALLATELSNLHSSAPALIARRVCSTAPQNLSVCGQDTQQAYSW